jgi:hypothetical protein
MADKRDMNDQKGQQGQGNQKQYSPSQGGSSRPDKGTADDKDRPGHRPADSNDQRERDDENMGGGSGQNRPNQGNPNR